MKLITTAILSTVCFSTMAQQNRVQLFSATSEKTVVRVLANGFDWQTVQTPQGDAKVILLDGGTPIAKEGQPDLPMLTVMLPAPEGEQLMWTAVQNGYTDFENMNVAFYNGSKPNLRKYDDEILNGFHPRSLFSLHEPVMIDGERMVMLKIYPVQYNPDLKTIRLHNELIITIQEQPKTNCNAQALAINEINVPEFTVYPNPALDILTIAYELESPSTVSLDIYNLAGQTVYSKNKGVQTACMQTATLDISDFAPGMYSLALRTDKGTTVQRVVVE